MNVSHQEDIWQSIRILKKPMQRPLKELDQTRESEQSMEVDDKENMFKQKDSQNCQCSTKIMAVKKDCMIQIRELRAANQQQCEELQAKYEAQIRQLKDQYDQEIKSLKEDIETSQLVNEGSDEQEIVAYFEKEQNNDRAVYKQSIDELVTTKIQLQHQLQLQQQEIQQLRTLITQGQHRDIQQSVHKNCASLLYRDTNRKDKIVVETDRAVLYEDSSAKNGFCNSIKNFNANVKLMDRSFKVI